MEKHADELLLAQFKKGDISVFEQVYKTYYKPLVTEAYLLLQNDQEAEDQVQALFIEIWDKKLYRNVHASLRCYLHRAIHNRCLNVLDKQKTRDKRFEQYSRTVEDRVSGNMAEMNERRRMLQTLLGELSTQRLEAFSLVYLEDKKYKEAAEEMGITVNSVKTHLRLALKTLQQKFKGL